MKKPSFIIISSAATAWMCSVPAFAEAIDASGKLGSGDKGDLMIGLGIAAAVVVVIIAVVLWLCLRKKGGHSGAGSGLSDMKSVRACYKKDEGTAERCVAYMATDTKAMTAKFSKDACDDISEYAAMLLSGLLDENDYVTPADEGEYVMYFRDLDVARAKQKLSDIVDILNKYQRQKHDGQAVPFVAGLYSVKNDCKNFDVALANAKLGYNRAVESSESVCICTKDIIRNEYNRVRLKNKLAQAIDNDEFEAFIQFIYGTKDKKFIGGEVLSRWNNPIDGFLTPAYYMNDMRAVGVIGKFDYYMLDKTCRILEKWKNTEFSDLTLSCNFTRITMSEDDFIQKFTAVVKKYSFDYGKLILEITEDAFFDNRALAYKNITECKKMGFGIAIDDFGAGSSSVSELSEYPVDVIKVDRQIIVKSTTKRGEALMEGLIKLAHSLGMQVLCEGVETEEQSNTAGTCCADYIQGYYYSYVFPLGESEDFFRKKKQQNAVAK